jgi:hypothetical protein
MNDRPRRRGWIPAAALVGAGYALVGVVFAEFARISAGREMRRFWRLSAWVVSFALLAAHLTHETRGRSPESPRAAFHVALGVALGAFGLAVWINLQPRTVAAPKSPLAPLALVVFPVVTGIPAFLGAWAAASVMARRRPGRSA